MALPAVALDQVHARNVWTKVTSPGPSPQRASPLIAVSEESGFICLLVEPSRRIASGACSRSPCRAGSGANVSASAQLKRTSFSSIFLRTAGVSGDGLEFVTQPILDVGRQRRRAP